MDFERATDIIFRFVNIRETGRIGLIQDFDGFLDDRSLEFLIENLSRKEGVREVSVNTSEEEMHMAGFLEEVYSLEVPWKDGLVLRGDENTFPSIDWDATVGARGDQTKTKISVHLNLPEYAYISEDERIEFHYEDRVRNWVTYGDSVPEDALSSFIFRHELVMNRIKVHLALQLWEWLKENDGASSEGTSGEGILIKES